ncbi:MAG TPA: FtsL-like putative cell division protein [Prolixibacteraceae bacterium]|nr:FtsL-like putative cell division protein [Prolixibacteraceae bacterium]
MTKKKENKSSRISKADLKSILGGTILASEKVTKQLPFVFFIVFLGIGLITNRYWTEKTIRRMEQVRDSLKEYKAESVIHETQLMYINRPSEVSKKVIERKIDLIEPVEPAKKIRVKKIESK